MFRAFFQPLADFALDHARVDAVPTRLQFFFADLREQIVVPAGAPGVAAGAFWQSATHFGPAIWTSSK